jgi:DNA-binding PadR family transcriptional regulator
MARSPQPLTPLSFHILLALTDQARHGYGIIKEMTDRTGGGVNPSTGSLYLALQRMEQEGLIEDAPDGPAPGEDARRRYYRITRRGREAAARESYRLAELIGVAVEKKLLGESALQDLLPRAASSDE